MEGKYIVLDGMDGSGKGTQVNLLKQKLETTAAFTYEPGGTPFADAIRGLVRDDPRAGESTALNNFLLFWAAREELVHNFIGPKLASGIHVISDRADSSTFALQLYGEQRADLIEAFMVLRKLIFSEKLNRRAPDLYIVLDLPAEVARDRVMSDTSRARNHLDDRSIEYYRRVRNGFREFSKYANVEFVDAEKSPEEVHQAVLTVLARHLTIPAI